MVIIKLVSLDMWVIKIQIIQRTFKFLYVVLHWLLLDAVKYFANQTTNQNEMQYSN